MTALRPFLGAIARMVTNEVRNLEHECNATKMSVGVRCNYSLDARGILFVLVTIEIFR